jgi:ABC-type Mn2+/Zn2+ transport system permease subunit
MMGLATIFAIFSSLIGLYLSYYLGIASGAAIVLVSTLLFAMVFLLRRNER